jgi:hypothetical protein
MKSIYTSKTFWVNIVSALIAILALPEIGQLSPQWLPYIGTVTAILNVFLRSLTTEPVSFKTPSQLPIVLLMLGLAANASACATVPQQPLNLSPEAQVAWRNLEIVRVLDLIRDTAIDAEREGLLTTGTTRKVVQFHISSLTILKAAEVGWQGVIGQTLDDLASDLPGRDRPMLGPYIGLIKQALGRN